MEKAAALQNSAAKNEAAKIELEAASRRTPPGPAVGISPHATLTLKKAALKYQWSAGGGTIPLSEGLWSTGRLISSVLLTRNRFRCTFSRSTPSN